MQVQLKLIDDVKKEGQCFLANKLIILSMKKKPEMFY